MKKTCLYTVAYNNTFIRKAILIEAKTAKGISLYQKEKFHSHKNVIKRGTTRPEE